MHMSELKCKRTVSLSKEKLLKKKKKGQHLSHFLSPLRHHQSVFALFSCSWKFGIFSGLKFWLFRLFVVFCSFQIGSIKLDKTVEERPKNPAQPGPGLLLSAAVVLLSSYPLLTKVIPCRCCRTCQGCLNSVSGKRAKLLFP